MDMGLGGLQELVMDREAWCAAVHGVAKSRTWLSNWTELNFLVEAETPILWPPDGKNWLKRPWFWERLKVGREGDDRVWDGWMESLTQWTWVWVDSGHWWWQGGMACCSPGGHKESDTTEQLNWFLLYSKKKKKKTLTSTVPAQPQRQLKSKTDAREAASVLMLPMAGPMMTEVVPVLVTPFSSPTLSLKLALSAMKTSGVPLQVKPRFGNLPYTSNIKLLATVWFKMYHMTIFL